jgi:trehalose-phosphatase
MLDYDGTLAPFVAERDKAVPYDGVVERLPALIEAPRLRLIVVSGRQIADLLKLLPVAAIPELWGSHGAERRLPDGSYHIDPSFKKLADVIREIDSWAAKEGLSAQLEAKPLGRAFHWRGQPDTKADRIARLVRDKLLPGLKDSDLEPHPFDGGLELRLKHVDKGRAVSSILSESNPDAVLAYLGDDLTDEDAFEAIGSRGLCVLVRKELRATAADLWLTPPADLYEFLDRWLAAVRGSKNGTQQG